MGPLDRFFIGLQDHFKQAAETQMNFNVAGYYRSPNYLSPANFYNHKTRTFLKNKRRKL